MVTRRDATMKLSKKASTLGGVPYRNSFSVLSDEVEMYEESKAADASQPKGKFRSLVTAGESLCRCLGREVRHWVRGH